MKKNRGFTLIESVITIAILGLIASIAVNIFSSVVQSYNKANILNELQQNGNYAISIMEQKIRNAENIINYQTMVSCPIPDVCADNEWLVIEAKGPRTNEPKCLEFGLEKPADTSKNQYLYQEESQNDADCNDNDPEEGKLELTNANTIDPKSGINVKELKFTVDTVSDPPRVKVRMILEKGKGAATHGQTWPDLELNTTVSLRNYK